MIEKSPFYELTQKHRVDVEFRPFIQTVGVSLKEFRAQRVEILDHSVVIFTSRTSVDSYFSICEQARITVPEGMKYICQTEAVALYLQKYIVYRKRKISFGDGSFTSLIELIVKNKAEKILLTLNEPHKPELPDALEKLKLNFSQVVLSRVEKTDISDLDITSFDAVALYSPSDVKNIIEAFGIEKLPAVVTFGESTLKSAVEASIHVKSNAPTPEAPSMAKALDNYLTKIEKGAKTEELEDVSLTVDTSKEEFLRTQQSKLNKRTRARRTTTTK